VGSNSGPPIITGRRGFGGLLGTDHLCHRSSSSPIFDREAQRTRQESVTLFLHVHLRLVSTIVILLCDPHRYHYCFFHLLLLELSPPRYTFVYPHRISAQEPPICNLIITIVFGLRRNCANVARYSTRTPLALPDFLRGLVALQGRTCGAEATRNHNHRSPREKIPHMSVVDRRHGLLKTRKTR